MEEKIYVEKLPKNCKECYFKQEYYKHSHDKCPDIWCGVGGDMTKEGCPLQLISDHYKEKDAEIERSKKQLEVIEIACKQNVANINKQAERIKVLEQENKELFDWADCLCENMLRYNVNSYCEPINIAKQYKDFKYQSEKDLKND